MGIQGLIDHVVTQPVALRSLSGSSFVIDGHCLLHKFAYRYATEYVLKGDISGIVASVVQTVKQFIQVSTHTILIFDGGMLPSKATTNNTRKEQRQKALDEAMAAQRAGKDFEFRKLIAQAINFPRERVIQIASDVTRQLRGLGNFFCFLSPYEADAQLVMLQKMGIADVIVTIDSDMLVYGPQRVLIRYENTTQTGEIVTFNGIFSRSLAPFEQSVSMLRKMAILSGCDYVKSLKGIGIVTAMKAIKQDGNLLSCCRALLDKKENPYGSPEEYVTLVSQAMFTFQYHLVLDPSSMECVHLQPVKEDAPLLRAFGHVLGRQLGPNEAREHCFPSEELRQCIPDLQKLASQRRQVCLIPDLPPLMGELDANMLKQGYLSYMGMRYKLFLETEQVEVLDPRFRSIQQAILRE